MFPDTTEQEYIEDTTTEQEYTEDTTTVKGIQILLFFYD